jgi:hypothetical protein
MICPSQFGEKELSMRKIIVIFLLLLSLILFSACGGPTKESEKPDINQQTEISPATSEDANDTTIVIGRPIKFDGFEFTITELKIVATKDDKQALRITYDWANTGKDALTPLFCYVLSGVQNDVEFEGGFVSSDDVNYDIGYSKVDSGEKVSGAQDAVPFDDIDVPFRLELKEMYGEIVYSLEINDLKEYK